MQSIKDCVAKASLSECWWIAGWSCEHRKQSDSRHLIRICRCLGDTFSFSFIFIITVCIVALTTA